MALAAVAVHHDPIRQPSANTRPIVTPPPQITSATLFRRSRQPACLVATNDATCDKQDVAGIDSGYATAESAASSPEGKDLLKRESSIASDILEIQERKLLKRKIIRLREFDKALPKDIYDRFADLCELVGKPLCDYLAKANLKYTSIGMKLKALGESEESAEPWIVVLCDPAILKRVKRFFQEQWVKDECQSFKIHFLNRAPQQRAGSIQPDVHQNPLSTISNAETLCGRAVMINHPNGFRAATLGGRIMVLNADGGLQAYALTAGHITSDTGSLGYKPEMDSSDDEHDSSEYDGKDEIDSDSELFELELDYEEEIDLQKDSGLHVQVNGHNQTSPGLWPKLGHIHATSYAADSNAANLDWALVTIDHPFDHLPNKLVESSKVHSQLTGPSVAPSQELPSKRSVVVMTGPDCAQRHGRLSDSTSSVLLAPGARFVPVYDLKFSDGSALKPGDCGTWAIDSSTDEVYGHVVASDVFGEAYVIPLGATFKDIEHQLGAEAVYLPRERELPTLHCEQEVTGNSASATISPCSDSFLGVLPTNATELTDFSLFEPILRYDEDSSSTVIASNHQEQDSWQHFWNSGEYSRNGFETFEMSQGSDLDKPLPDSGYASNQTSQPNSPESPLKEPPVVLFNPPDNLSPSYSFDEYHHHLASQLFIPTNRQHLPEDSPREPPAHPPLSSAEYPAMYPTRDSEARLINRLPTREKANAREKIRSWFRRYVARKEDGLRDRPTLPS